MPLPRRDFRAIGPKEGQRFPEVRLSDQTGALVDLHAHRTGRPALVVFYRSAEWCPFCKTQLVELQRVAPLLAVNGVALFAISYDAVDILAAFAAEHDITYPLLSDDGSRVMRELGLINERVQDDHAVYGIKPDPRHVGLPYPGVFVLDGNGVITDKRFHDSYRERETGGSLVAQALGIFAEPSAPPVTDGPVAAGRAWLDWSTYAWFQRLTLTVELTIAPAFHVYGQPVADGLTPLSVEIGAIDGLEVGPARWPAPRRFDLPGFNEGLWVHEGVVRGTVSLTFTDAPGAGDHLIGVTVRYQAGDDTSRLVPSSLRLAVPVREAALVGHSLPGPAPKSP